MLFVIRAFLCVFVCGSSLYADRSDVIDLRDYEAKFYSEHGEDGVLEKIFEIIGPLSKIYVEFGVQDGTECNTRYLREKHGFHGLLMDMGHENSTINLKKEIITAENINALLEKHKIPEEFDLLSIDIDSNDFYVWHAMKHRPRVVVVEYNPNHPPHQDKVIVYNPNQFWDHTSYFGASILALYNLGCVKGYSLIYAETGGCNLFFIRNDILAEVPVTFKNINDPIGLYKIGYHQPDPLGRKYITSTEAIELLQ
ncbi:MAG TPA: hypothetical protein VFU89_02410 [Rhabdochlamydiaceae bacterium]|nr:hypothetical protein [Rhabdochlamydiaceae bacterium]